MFEDMYLETDRLVLRPYTMDDLFELHKIVSQKEVMKYLPEGVMTQKQTKKTLTWIIECYKENTQKNIKKFSVGVFLKENKKLIGWCGLGPLEFDPSEIEIYYGLSKSHWGKGFATEAARALLDYGFRIIGLKKIVAIVMPQNNASKRVIEKMGLVYRKQIENLPAKYKAYQEDVYFSLTRDEYDSIKYQKAYSQSKLKKS
jgi:ribosomal-protein-alanine N-acetyltransferase